MTKAEIQEELNYWMKEWESDLSVNIDYLNFVSDMIDLYRERLKRSEEA